MKSLIFYLLIIFLLSPIFTFNTESVSAQTDYELLAPIPLGGPGTPETETTKAGPYIEGLFRLTIAIAGGLAVLAIIFGGIKYISTATFDGKSDARNTIENAIWGLMLALGAWLIMTTVNPSLSKFNLKIPVASTTEVGLTSSTPRPMTQAELDADASVRAQLPGISVNNLPCATNIYQSSGCTNLNGLPPNTIIKLNTLKADCVSSGCNIRITGGTEPGAHKSHGVGMPIVDIDEDQGLKNWLKSKNINTNIGGVVLLSNGGRAEFYFEYAGQGNSTGDHWHVIF